MITFITLAMTGLSLATAPVADSRAPSGNAQTAQPAAQPSPQRRYCFKYQVTGSILPYKACKTYSEWMKDGVDPTAKP